MYAAILKELREREGKATDGPWIIHYGSIMTLDVQTYVAPMDDIAEEDAELICSMRNQLLLMLNRIEALEAANEILEKQARPVLYDAVCPVHTVQGVMAKGDHVVCDWPCGRRLTPGDRAN